MQATYIKMVHETIKPGTRTHAEGKSETNIKVRMRQEKTVKMEAVSEYFEEGNQLQHRSKRNGGRCQEVVSYFTKDSFPGNSEDINQTAKVKKKKRRNSREDN